MKIWLSLGLATLIATTIVGDAWASNTKGTSANSATCRTKLDMKHVKKADWKVEHDKCMNDPMGYE